MVRSLVMFFGVCLLVPASGCFFEEGGSGGSSGGGGAGTDACVNADDTAIVCDAGFVATHGHLPALLMPADRAQDTAQCLDEAGSAGGLQRIATALRPSALSTTA